MILGLLALLKANPTATGAAGQNVFFGLIPEPSPAAAIELKRVGGSSDALLAGGAGMQKLRVQIGVVAVNAPAAEAIQQSLRNFLDPADGPKLTATLTDGSYIDDCQFIQNLDTFDYEPRKFRLDVEYYFWFALP